MLVVSGGVVVDDWWQVEALVPTEGEACEATAPETRSEPSSMLPQPRYHGGNNKSDQQEQQVSAKDRVLQRKEAQRQEDQRKYEEVPHQIANNKQPLSNNEC